MKRKGFSRILFSLTLCLMLTLSAAVQSVAAKDGEAQPLERLAKTAEALDANLETKITLSLPGKQDVEPADVVFVLDKSGASAQEDIYRQAKDFLGELKKQSEERGLNIKVGVVLFNMHGNVRQELTDVVTGYDSILKAMNSKVSMGTNLHAGLLAAQSILDKDTEVKARNKHVVLISDGATYLYSKDKEYTKAYTRSFGDPKAQTNPATGKPYLYSRDMKGGIWESQSREYNTPNDFKKFSDGKNFVFSQANTKEKLGEYLNYYRGQEADAAKNWSQYEYEYTVLSAYANMGRKVTPIDVNAPANIDVAYWSADDTFQEMARAGYDMNVFFKNAADFDGSCFLKYLARNTNGGELNTDFVKLKKELLDKISTGSYVEDFMGEEFDFVDDLGKIKLRVGDEALTGEKAGEHRYGFGKRSDNSYRFVLTYAPGDEEKIKLEINETVYPKKPVVLEYREKLVAANKTPGTYEAKTNRSATLYPVDANGKKGEAMTFPVPTVKYEVKKSTPAGSTPQGNKHSARPRTGDDTKAILYAVLLGVSGAAIFAVSRRKKREN